MTPAYIGLRYSRARAENRFLSFITWVSLLGLALGVVALIVVVSVMNGFDTELKRRILGAVPHVVVEGLSREELEAIPGVRSVSRFSRQSVLLVNGSVSELVTLYGVEPGNEHAMSIIPNNMIYGSVEDLREGGIVLGEPLAYRLGLMPGDSITVLVPLVKNTWRLDTQVINATLIGSFKLDSELDYHLSLMDLTTLEGVLGQKAPTYRLRLDDIFVAPSLSEELRDNIKVTASDWSADYGDFFRTVKMEKVMMFLLLILVVGIAAFSIVSSLSMLVKEKQFDIAVLRTCGLSSREVTIIFVVQGAVIGICGIFLGALCGLPLAYYVTEVVGAIESLFGVSMLTGTYFDSIPSDVRIGDVAAILLVSLFISLVATIYPAYRAASVDPAQVLRYE